MRDRAPAFIALADLLLCVLSVVIVAVAPPSKAKGPERKAEFLIIERLRDWSSVVRFTIGTPIAEGDGGPVFVVHLDSPLISEDTPHVEIVLNDDGLRFKPWRDV